LRTSADHSGPACEQWVFEGRLGAVFPQQVIESLDAKGLQGPIFVEGKLPECP
jgi:hypothetical protein